jgi:DNA-directed RNA polymerase specialized sigma24 family protein
MRDETGIGGSRGRFPTTSLSAVGAAGSRDPGERDRGFSALIQAYWKPVYKYVRLKWGMDNESAKDATQGFFARAFEKSWLASYEPKKGSFRTFLRACLDGFLANERKAALALKRYPGEPLVSLDFESAEMELAGRSSLEGRSPDDFFREEFARALFSSAVEQLRRELFARGSELAYRAFERYDLDPDPEDLPTYASLARALGSTESRVTNALQTARREFRRIVLENLRALTRDDSEFREEARRLLGKPSP